MNKKVLFIAYYFPPLGGVGVQRTIKYVKYLEKFHYDPIVVTVKKGHNYAYDYGMLSEIPENAKVYRSNSGEKLFFRYIIENADTIIKKFRYKKNSEKDNSNYKESSNIKINKEGIKTKVFRYLEYNYYVPDTKIRWFKHAIKDIRNRVLVENDIDVIYSTSAPYTDHLIALEVKKITQKPWIVDLRDPWVGNKFIYDRYNDKRKEKERKLELEVISNADIVIHVTEDMVKEYSRRYPQYKEKFIAIPNGFDKNDLKSYVYKKEEKFVIRYTGTLSEGFSIKSFLKALEEISDGNKEFNRNFTVEFTGFIAKEHLEIIKNSKIKSNIKFNSFVTHGQAISLMKNAHANLLVLPDEENSRGIYTGKLFDYLLVEKPIIGIMPVDGIAGDIINNNNIGRAIEHSDINGLKNYIMDLYSKYKDGLEINTQAIRKCSQFDRENLTKSLTTQFNALLKKREEKNEDDK